MFNGAFSKSFHTKQHFYDYFTHSHRNEQIVRKLRCRKKYFQSRNTALIRLSILSESKYRFAFLVYSKKSILLLEKIHTSHHSECPEILFHLTTNHRIRGDIELKMRTEWRDTMRGPNNITPINLVLMSCYCKINDYSFKFIKQMIDICFPTRSHRENIFGEIVE